MKRAALCSLLAMVILGAAASAAGAETPKPLDARLVAAHWPAQWIVCPGAPVRDPGVYAFRKEIKLDAVPAHYWVHVSADNRFLLHVNGRYAAEGPARGDLLHWRFETVDLAPMLHTGNNVIAALVWNFGRDAPVAQMSDRTGFLMQGDTAAEDAVNTGTEWRVHEERGRSSMAHNGAQGYYAAGPAEKIDGRVLDWNWDQSVDAAPASAGASAWLQAQTIGHAATREAQDAPTHWELTQDELPPMEHRLTDAGEVVHAEGSVSSAKAFPGPVEAVEIPANSHVTLLLDHRVLQTAYPELITSGGRDADIRMIYAEALYDAEGNKGDRNEIAGRRISGITDEFISDGGEHRSYSPLWWRTWRYLQLEITTKDQPLHLDTLRAWFTAYPFEERAKVDGDVPQLDAIFATGWRTARLCAHETYMDAPYWEQLQYVGDTRIQALISYAMSGDSRLARQAIGNIDDSRTPEGITGSRYPSGLPQFIPPFSLLWVGMVHDYWMYVNDEVLVRQTVPHTRTVMDWFAARVRPDGLLGKLPWWEFGDWTSGYGYGTPPQDTDGGSTFLTLQFVAALEEARELELKFGSAERAAQYQTMIDRAREAVNRESLDAASGLYADTPAKKSFSTQANVLAVLTDTAPKAAQAEIIRRVLTSQEKNATTLDGRTVPPMSQMSFYFRFYLSRAMVHAGVGDLYLEQLGPWRQMLKLGLSTWAEMPEPTRSDCHAWSAAPNYDLLTVVAGIAPGAPGFRSVRIEPHLGSLTHFEAAMPHGEGEIRVAYVRQGSAWTAKVTLPAGLDGTFVWKGQERALHAGTQELSLPAE
ncbi:alpha-L-rhamnosidase C-terminal domain-containing protein [Silvibacterium sp.]|uniref:alpha-L-rhamnosidase-related protein n=1 Tax=Silvibacterium sp. TaxID=1964179 RepID=UPI0039E4EA43